MELYCKKNGIISIISIIIVACCFWWIFSSSLDILDYWETDPVMFWSLTIILGPMLLIGNLMILYALALLVHDYVTLGIQKKPVATYDDKVFRLYDPIVFKYREFKWEDIQCFEAYIYNGMSKVQVKLNNPKLVFMYNYQITFKGLSFGSDLKGEELQKFVSDLNQKLVK